MDTTPRYTDIDNLDDNDDLAIALGNMLVAWAAAENALSDAMALICGIDANMAMLSYYRIPTFESRVKFIRSLLLEWKTSKHDKAAIDTAIDKLSKLARARNHWVHGCWAREKGTNNIVVFDFRSPEGRGRNKPVKAADVDNHIEAVYDRTEALRDLIPMADILP